MQPTGFPPQFILAKAGTGMTWFFYFSNCHPREACPRHDRGAGIRNPGLGSSLEITIFAHCIFEKPGTSPPIKSRVCENAFDNHLLNTYCMKDIAGKQPHD